MTTRCCKWLVLGPTKKDRSWQLDITLYETPVSLSPPCPLPVRKSYKYCPPKDETHDNLPEGQLRLQVKETLAQLEGFMKTVGCEF